MNQIIKTIALLLFVSAGQVAFAQSKQEQALAKARKAIELMDSGKLDESIVLLEEAHKLDPDDINYPYELGYAYYVKQDYKKASKYLESIINSKDANDRVFQLMGNTYDNLGKGDKAIDTYEAGLKKFPNSGSLYLELGVMQMGKKEYNKALGYFEKGIEVEPRFSSNYYWAARIYCSSTEEVWGMIYGEIFMNIERNSKRTAEISKMLYDTYASQITFENGNPASVSFSQNATITITDPSKIGEMKLPYGIGVYEPTLMMALISSNGIDINSLDKIRTGFVDLYFSNGHDQTYPNALFSFQKQVKEAGHLEAYNHWILMKGDENGFTTWQNANKEMWQNFANWFGDNGMPITETNRFYSGQY